MIEEKRKQRELELGDSISLDRTSSPHSRHDKWKREHQRKVGEFISDVTREVVQKIDGLVEQTKSGLFASQDRRDILVEAIETEEHYGCVCGQIGFVQTGLVSSDAT
ncbi:unnamed protein product [Lathyrus oleraceus]